MNLHLHKHCLIKTLTILLIAGFSSCIAIVKDADGDGYSTFRAEGLSLSEAAPSGISYIRKYLNKNLQAHDTIRSIFDDKGRMASVSGNHPPAEKKVLSLAFVGDIMWIRNGWNSFLDDSLRKHLAGYDVVIGNLETPVDTTRPFKSFLPDYSRYNSDPGLIRSFRKEDGSNIFTALSLANNHAYDMKGEGIANTLSFLTSEGIMSTGASMPGSNTPYYLTISRNGIKIGLYAAGWGLNEPEELSRGEIEMNIIPGLAPLNEEKIDISALVKVLDAMKDDSVDFRIVYLHWGYEFEGYPDPAIIRTGRKIAAAGADLVVGTHPHLIQPWETWITDSDSGGGDRRTSLIVYSLGNFTTTMYTPECRLGMIMSLNLYRNIDSGACEWREIEPVLVYNDPGGPGRNNRKLLLYKDYIKSEELLSPRRADRIKESLKPLTTLVVREPE